VKTSAKMMAIDLSKLQPFDIILTTTTLKESRLIRLGQAIARAKASKISHVSLVVTPTVFIEAGDDGIVFEQFCESNTNWPIHLLRDVPVARKFQSRRKSRARLRLIIDDSDREAAAPKIYGALPDASCILVRRHKAFSLEASRLLAKDKENRYKLFECIDEHYLKLYHEYTRLVSVVNMPKYIKTKIVGWGRKIQRVIDPGPFCSELVATIYQSVKTGILAGDPGEYAPIDFAESNDFETIDCVKEVDFTRRYGRGIHQLANLLYIDATPKMTRNWAQITGLLDLIVHLLRTKGKAREKIVYRRLNNNRDLEFIRNWGFFVSDRVFAFIKSAPECFAKCPHRKLVKAASEEGPPSLLELASNERCHSIYQCSWFLGEYDYSLNDVEKRRDKLYQQLWIDLDHVSQ
jgi:hypothetical protein